MSVIAIAVVIVLFLLTVLLAVVKELLIDEARAWLPHIARALVRSAARGLPGEHRVRYEEEWLGELAAYADRPLTAIVHAASLRRSGCRALRSTLMTRHRVSIAERVIAFLTLCVMVPALAAIALAIRLDSPGPVIYRSKRTRVDGRTYHLWRFRTMPIDVLEHSQTGLWQHRDPRLTNVGLLLHDSSVDYLPSLVNVVLGDKALWRGRD